ncbi:hypothetical protein UFOVP1590_33 [uncultured Caudovirales phage]|uniref:Uncharacterized protein n=1 Tax=uncultured Caudovirales phage TaxID=2100421 RepID=A0A6J5SPT9_9CAUD|nr:hypothetical protein UFOVP1590_33 [uncultured Caudovirales phage]
MKRPKPKRPGAKQGKWSQNQKLEAVMTYLMLGNMKEAAIVTGIPYDTFKCWKYTDWFKELLVTVRESDIQQMDSNLQRIVGKALKVTEDRIDLGEYQFDPKTSKVIRVPIKANVALKISTELMNRQDKLRAAPEKKELEKTIDARLARLSEEFARFASSKVIEGEAVLVSP